MRLEALPSTESKRSVLYLPSHHASLDPPHDDSTAYEPPPRGQSPRETIYETARLEKTARAEEFSAIKRAVSKNVIVIADAPNYIKGFRYQLYCEAKAAGTRSVVVHTSATEEECQNWNNARIEAWGWPTNADDEENEKPDASKLPGPQSGKDVLGDLQPESHTAIYGDLAVNGGTRSRNSRPSGAVSDDEAELGTDQQEDAMTLKSLYISDKHKVPLSASSTQTPASTSTQEASLLSPPSYKLPSTNPPSARLSLPYSPRSFKSLFMRYEPPSPFTRWDTPLFTIPSTDAHPPYDAIWSAIFPAAAKPTSKKALLRQRHEEEHAQKDAAETEKNGTGAHKKDLVPEVRQHAATVLPSVTAPSALQVLESTTGEIVKLVLASARASNVADAGEGGDITITLAASPSNASGDPEEASFTLEVPEAVALSQPSLQRARRKFTQMQRGAIAHGQGYTAGRRNVAEGFVKFLEAEWEGAV